MYPKTQKHEPVRVRNPLSDREYDLSGMQIASFRVFPFQGQMFKSAEFYSSQGECDSFVVPEENLWVHIYPGESRRLAVNTNHKNATEQHADEVNLRRITLKQPLAAPRPAGYHTPVDVTKPPKLHGPTRSSNWVRDKAMTARV